MSVLSELLCVVKTPAVVSDEVGVNQTANVHVVKPGQ